MSSLFINKLFFYLIFSIPLIFLVTNKYQYFNKTLNNIHLSLKTSIETNSSSNLSKFLFKLDYEDRTIPDSRGLCVVSHL